MQFETGKRNSSKIEIPHSAPGPINHSFMSLLKGTLSLYKTSSWFIYQGSAFTELCFNPT